MNGPAKRERSNRVNAVNDLPIFPLGMPLFAGGVLPLQIFEARYLDMVSECSRHDKPFGVCMITRGGEAGKAAEHAQVGTLATIRDFDQTEAGLLYIRTLGSERFRILRRWIQDNGLIRAEVLVLDDRDDLAQSTLESSFAPLAALLKQLHGQLKQQHPEAFEKVLEKPLRYTEPAWVTNRLIELLQVSNLQKQQWLELSAGHRQHAVHSFLEEQQAV